MSIVGLAVRLLVATVVAAMAATVIYVVPAQATEPGDAAFSAVVGDADDGLELSASRDRIVIRELTSGTITVTDMSTGETARVRPDGELFAGGTVAVPTSSHNLVIGCGWAGWLPPRFYCDFTREAQSLAIDASIVTLTGIICAASPYACPFASGIAIALSRYAQNHALCARGIRVYSDGASHCR